MPYIFLVVHERREVSLGCNDCSGVSNILCLYGNESNEARHAVSTAQVSKCWISNYYTRVRSSTGLNIEYSLTYCCLCVVSVSYMAINLGITLVT